MKVTIVRTCESCLYAGTHEKCEGCLGSNEEIEARQAQGLRYPHYYLYKNWVEGDGVARVIQFEREGKRNIVIGGQGEAEVNVKWSPEETLSHLCNVAEECGYLVRKGRWSDFQKEILVSSHGVFAVRYTRDKLDVIVAILEKVLWRAQEPAPADQQSH